VRTSGPCRTRCWCGSAAQRGIDFEPTPPAVSELLPRLVRVVADTVDELSQPRELRWIAAALAALSHQTQAAALAADTTITAGAVTEPARDDPAEDQA